MSKIRVTGDLSIDLLKQKYKNNNKENAWDYNGYTISKLDGGAFLLANMIKLGNPKNEVIGYNTKKIKNENKKLAESMVHIKSFPQSSPDKNKVSPIRIKQFCGFKKPDNNEELEMPGDYCPLATSTICNTMSSTGLNNNPFDLVVIHDSNLKFRQDEEKWPDKIFEAKNIVHKMARPLADGPLWEKMKDDDVLNKLTVVIEADDLREEEGLRISRSLSWERTAYDFLNEMKKLNKNSELQNLLRCKNLIVRFGTDGAIQYTENGEKIYLYFDPNIFEGHHKSHYPGNMYGLRIAFLAGLILGSLEEVKGENAGKENSENISLFNIEYGIKKGILLSRELLKLGFEELKNENGEKTGKVDYPFQKLFENQYKDHDIIKVEVVDDPNWKIINKKLTDKEKIYEVASEYVLIGESSKLKSPTATFGKLKTADRDEIESYHSVRNLIKEYLTKDTAIPLSIAVFGHPGSGKSFGVTEIANTISENIEKIEFNLSQFQSPNDLLNAFHRVQSTSLEGKTPLVFFDEFDSNLENGKYGWLKYFLSPMNDGTFKLGERTHPIGKSIFVFAGGSIRSFQEFNPEKGLKGSDFKSRLRGFVNIAGINSPITDDNIDSIVENILSIIGNNSPNDDPEIDSIVDDILNIISIDNNLYMIRRAMILRGILKDIASNLFEEDSEGKEIVNIDPCVLNALIKVPKYKHGVRSMKAIIEMSILSNMKKFERSALPSSQQLELHVDIDKFKKYLDEPECNA